MKSKKVTAFLLCAAMVSAMGLAGCASNNTAAKKEETKDSNSFSMFVDATSDDGYFYMLDQIEKQTDVKVDLEYYAYEVAREKLSLAFSTGSYADVIGGWCLRDSDILTYGVNQGIFIPLEDYLEKYPNLKKALDEPGVRETMTAPDGHIYALPYVLDAPKVAYNIHINTRWLDNLGLEMPTTTEEYYQVLKAFKEQDANGNGDPNDEIPLSFDPDNRNINMIPGWFGSSSNGIGITVEDGVPQFGANTDAFKEGITFLSKLYSEGLIDTEAFTQDLSQWKAKGVNDVYGSSMMYASGDIMPYNAGEVPDWAPLPVLRGSDTVDPVWYQSSTGISVLKSQLVVTNKATNVDEIMKFWDAVYEEENSISILNGPVGDVVTKEDDGYHKIDITTRSVEEQEKYSWANLFPQALPKYLPLGFKMIEDPAPYEEKPIVDAEYEPYLTGALPSWWMPLEEADRMAEIETSLIDYIKQKTAEWIAGQADIDKEWESYKKQLDTLGAQDYIKMRQETAQ